MGKSRQKKKRAQKRERIKQHMREQRRLEFETVGVGTVLHRHFGDAIWTVVGANTLGAGVPDNNGWKYTNDRVQFVLLEADGSTFAWHKEDMRGLFMNNELEIIV